MKRILMAAGFISMIVVLSIGCATTPDSNQIDALIEQAEQSESNKKSSVN
jgi:hypothetical protein